MVLENVRGRVLHLRYMQEDMVELVVPRHQAQDITKRLIDLGHTMVSNYSALDNHVRRGRDSEEQRQRRNAYCASRALRRAIRGNKLGRSVTIYYENLINEVEGKFPDVFTDDGQKEFQRYLGAQNIGTKDNDVPASTRDNSVPTDK